MHIINLLKKLNNLWQAKNFRQFYLDPDKPIPIIVYKEDKIWDMLWLTTNDI